MKTKTIFTLLTLIVLFASCNTTTDNKKADPAIQPGTDQVSASNVEVIHLTTAEFKAKVFDYETNTDWKYEGDIPCIVDFYADWCGPCKRIAPILDELAKEYDGKIVIYKVDTDKERELSAAFGIRSIPTILFVPMEGKPQMAQGALPKESFVKAIDEVLLGNGQNS